LNGFASTLALVFDFDDTLTPDSTTALNARRLLPRDPALRPNQEIVEERYGMFRRAG